MAMLDKLNCATINVCGLKDGAKRLSLFRYLEEKNIHVALLQETYCSDTFENNFIKGWNGSIYHSFSASNHSIGRYMILSSQTRLKHTPQTINLHSIVEVFSL